MGLGSRSGRSIKRHRARIEVSGRDEIIETIHRALEPEIKSPPNPERVRASASYSGGKLIIEIASRDIPSLRASINSYIYLAYAALKSLEAMERSGFNQK